MLKRFLALATAVLIFVAAGTVSAAKEQTESKENGYKAVAENSDFRLSADMSTGDFMLSDLSSGSTWYSGQWEVLDENSEAFQLNTGRVKTDLVSMLAVNYVQLSTIAGTATPSYQNSYAYCVAKGNVKTEQIKNGYRAEYYFSDIEATVPVEVTISDKGLETRIIGRDISMGEEYYITSIELLPGFMAAENKYDGYLFVPSGSGALVPLNSGKGDFSAYSEMVYGSDAAVEVEEYTGEERNILVPVYGIVKGESAITAIITEGDVSAAICAEADSSATSFTRIYSEYITATIDSTTLFESNFENQRIINGIEKRKVFSDFTVNYRFLSGENADYSGMAAVYRNYLSLDKKANAPSLYMTLYGAATKKASFLGISYTKTISLTNFGETEKILSEMNENGIPVSLQYIGWNNSGIENKKTPVKFNPVSVLGGKKGYKKLYNYIKGSDNTLYSDVDLLSIRKSRWGFSVLSDVSKSIFNTRTPQYKYMLSVYVPVNNENPWYLLRPEKVKEAADKFLKSYKYDTGISFSGIGDTLYSDFSKKGCVRSETEKYYAEIMKAASKNHPLAVSTGNSYTYEYADSVFSLPMTNDGNLLFSESVPFVQMVLHGSVSYSSEKGATILDCVEYGANPYFSGIYSDDSELIETTFNWLSGSTYSKWRDSAEELYTDYSKAYETLYDNYIVKHSVSDGVSRLTFDNGSVILINRNDKSEIIDGTEIPPNDFKVIGG